MEKLIQEAIQTHIFRTNIKNADDMGKVEHVFASNDEITRWSIDLDDWEKVLKVETHFLGLVEVTDLVRRIGFECSELDH